MTNEIVRQWVEANIFPQVSVGFKWTVWGFILLGCLLLAGHYDYQILMN